MRTIVAPDGRCWRVTERQADPNAPGARRSLVFDGTEVMRRVVNYPPRWHELSDGELYALSLSR